MLISLYVNNVCCTNCLQLTLLINRYNNESHAGQKFPKTCYRPAVSNPARKRTFWHVDGHLCVWFNNISKLLGLYLVQ